MIPLVDIHCHLLAGLDDGPSSDEDALVMCQMAAAEGTSLMAATAHQSPRWNSITPQAIRDATRRLARSLRDENIPVTVLPCAEIMVEPNTVARWRNDALMSVADRREYLLLEMPRGVFIDLRDTVTELRQTGIRPILAHPERHPELLHEHSAIDQLIRLGCLVQVSSSSVTDSRSGQDRRAIKRWIKRGVVHLVGSDGHSPNHRPPLIADAYRCIERWAGSAVADRLCSTNGMAIVQGLTLRVPPPQPVRRRWFVLQR